MNNLKRLAGIFVVLLSINANATSTTFEGLTWVYQNKDIQEHLKGHYVSKTFEQYLDCRATFCFEYVICSATHDYNTEKTEYFITRVSGASIFFKKDMNFSVETSDTLQEICK